MKLISIDLSAHIVEALRHAGCEVFIASTPHHAESLLSGSSFDAVIASIDTQPSNTSFVPGLRKRGYRNPIIGFDADAALDAEAEASFLLAGGSYLLRSSVSPAIISAICGIGSTGTAHKVIVFYGNRVRIDQNARMLFADEKPVTLRRRQFDVTYALASKKGGVLSRQELLDAIDASLDHDERIVDVHVGRARRAIERVSAGCGGCIQTLYGVGYRALP